MPTAFRDALVLHYEIPKWDGDMGPRNVYLPLTAAMARRKAELLDAGLPVPEAGTGGTTRCFWA